MLERADRDERRAERGDRNLVGLAHVEQEEVLVRVLLALELLDGDLRDAVDHVRRRRPVLRDFQRAGWVAGFSMPQNWS